MITSKNYIKLLNQRHEFPKLMERDDCGIVILFVSENAGMVLYSESSLFMVGGYENCIDINLFKDYAGELSLSNSVTL